MTFSIVIPCKSRPRFLEWNLICLKNQDYMDFEVIVSDDSDSQEIKRVFTEQVWDDKRFVYYHTDHEMSMNEHLDFAGKKASGQYIMLCEDKSILFCNALGKLAETIIEEDYPQMVSFNYVLYQFADEAKGDYRGNLVSDSFEENSGHVVFDPCNVVNRYLTWSDEKTLIHGGFRHCQLLMGMWRRDFYEEIWSLFDGVARSAVFVDGDMRYTAGCLGKKAVYLNDPLLIWIDSETSTGLKVSTYWKNMKQWLDRIPNQAVLNTELPYIERVHASEYYLLLGIEWHVLIMRSHGMEVQGVDVPSAIAHIRYEVENMNRLDYSIEEKEEDRKRIEKALAKLTKEETDRYTLVWNDLNRARLDREKRYFKKAFNSVVDLAKSTSLFDSMFLSDINVRTINTVEDIDAIYNAILGEDVFIVGAGDYGVELGKYFLRTGKELAGFVDGRKQGELLGKKIISYEATRDKNAFFFISSPPYARDMIQNLRAYGTKDERIYSLSSIDILIEIGKV